MVSFLVMKKCAQEVAISEFKAKCLALLEQVRRTKRPIRITRFGKPVAEVVPPSGARRRTSGLAGIDGGYDGDPGRHCVSGD
jgi:prevent-host-death family protein